MAVLLAAISAITFGVGDFLGGLSARRMAAATTALVTQVVGLAVVVVAAVAVGGSPSGGDLLWGVAAGVVGPTALMVFYWSLGAGQMSVVAPVSAVTSALVPLLYGLLDGERPGALALGGALLALPAIVLISREPGDPRGADERDDPPRGSTPLKVLAGAAASGIGFGTFFVLLSRSADDSGLWPLTSARLVAVPVVAVVVLAGGRTAADRVGVAMAAGAGAFDIGANTAFLLASRQGLLTLVGVIGSMYPASTVVLARVLLNERLARHQLMGLGLALIALVAVTAG